MKPCLECGTPTADTRCPDHTIHPAKDRQTRGYDWAWQQLSARARKLQPWCTDCGTTDNLTADHTPQAWRRKAAGKPIRLQDIDVVCIGCNNRRGAARPGSRRAQTPTGDNPHESASPPAPQANFPLHTTPCSSSGGV